MSTQTTSQPPPPCHLLSLPPELRNRIWRFTLVKPSAVEVFAVLRDGYPVEPRHIYKYAHVSHGYPYLLGVSRQIRDEGKAIYFEENTFRFDRGAGSTGCVRTFERWSGASARRMKRVKAG